MHYTDEMLLRWLYAGVLFLMGLAVGSFLNVVAYRVPMGVSLLHPPSSCPSCGKNILARDNLPLFGWLLLRGKCRSCQQPISVRYPLVELATGILWGLVGWRLGATHLGYWNNVFVGLLGLAFVSAMVITFLVDMDYLIILDEVSMGGTAVALIVSALFPFLHQAATPGQFAFHHSLLNHVVGGMAPWVCGLSVAAVGMITGIAFALVIYYVGNATFREQIEAAREEDPEVDSALGLGDVKLMAFFGALMGWQAVFFVFLTGSALAAIYGTIRKLGTGDPGDAKGMEALRRRWETGSSLMPFGPFLVLGALGFFFLGDEIRLWVANNMAL